MSGITILGLGPGDPGQLTREAWDLINSIPEIYLRTRQHPVVAGFPAQLRIHSFDHFYEDGQSLAGVYARIAGYVIELGRRPEGVIYAVPGHPFVAEASTPEILRRAQSEGIVATVIHGLSFLETVFSALRIDPLPHTSVVDALEIATVHHPFFPPSAPAIIAQIHSPAIATEVKLTLMAVYPDEHPVKLVHAAGTPHVLIESLPLYEIDRGPHIGLLTTLYLPSLGESTSFESFQELVAHLRAPEGCPWDREQNHQTLRTHLLEETYEVLEALDSNEPHRMREEFGDLLLQIVLHAQIASEYGEFTMVDILQEIHDKLVRRHPHVFGEVKVEGKQGVLQNWERLKAAERQGGGRSDRGLLDGIATGLPALLQAETYQKRAARVGFDWPNVQGVLDKIREELKESRQVTGPVRRSAEIGDLLFAVVNLARWYEVDAESALREANARFRARFAHIEAAARQRGVDLSTFSLEEMDALWEEAKRNEPGAELGDHPQGSAQ